MAPRYKPHRLGSVPGAAGCRTGCRLLTPWEIHNPVWANISVTQELNYITFPRIHFLEAVLFLGSDSTARVVTLGRWAKLPCCPHGLVHINVNGDYKYKYWECSCPHLTLKGGTTWPSALGFCWVPLNIKKSYKSRPSSLPWPFSLRASQTVKHWKSSNKGYISLHLGFVLEYGIRSLNTGSTIWWDSVELSAPSEIPSLLLLPVCSALFFFHCLNVFIVFLLWFSAFEITFMSAGSSEEASR